MIDATPDIQIREEELNFAFIRASGPGGQNVNKVATAVQLRFDVANSPSLPDDVRVRLTQLAGRRLTEDGELVIEARRYRTQEQNRRDAVERLLEMIRHAARKPARRVKTRPSAASRQRRLDAKRRRGQTKKQRETIRETGD